MVTISYTKPHKDEFRITKTDIKNALKAVLSSNIYKLNKEFQGVLDFLYSSLRFTEVKRHFDEFGNLREMMVHYDWYHTDVIFHVIYFPRDSKCFATNYQNTTSGDLNYTLMNTLIPLLEEFGLLQRNEIDSFLD